MTEYVLRVNCGNCGQAFWLHDFYEIGAFALTLHEHWASAHVPKTVHLPTTTVFVGVPHEGECLRCGK